MRDYHQLDLWQRAMTYAVRIYEFTAQLPDTERYNLASQTAAGGHIGPLEHRRGLGLHQ
jgi:hypothetical protein